MPCHADFLAKSCGKHYRAVQKHFKLYIAKYSLSQGIRILQLTKINGWINKQIESAICKILLGWTSINMINDKGSPNISLSIFQNTEYRMLPFPSLNTYCA